MVIIRSAEGKNQCSASVESAPYLTRHQGQASLDHAWVLRIGKPHAFPGMRPGRVESDEKAFTRYRQHAGLLQALVQLSAADWHTLEPAPEKERTLWAMQPVGQAVKRLLRSGNGVLHAIAIEGLNRCVGQLLKRAAADKILGQRRSDSAAGQGKNGVGAVERSNHGFAGDDNAGAQTRQPKLRQAQCQDRSRRPAWFCLGKRDIRERRTVGAIDNQGYVPRSSQGFQRSKFLSIQDIA